MKKLGRTFLFVFSCILFTACSNESVSNDIELPTGAITGRVVYSNCDDSQGIIVELEKSDGNRSIRLFNRSLANYTAPSDGSFVFNSLEDGLYTIYAFSNSSSEKAVSANVQVADGKTTDAGEIKLTATGGIKGIVTLDSKIDENEGITVCIAGTSYFAVTDSYGNYTINGIPACEDYTLVVIKGVFSKTLKTKVTVKAKEITNVQAENITTSEIDAVGLKGEKGDKGDKGDTGNKGDDTSTINEIIYKNIYSPGAYKNVFNISDVGSERQADFYQYGTLMYNKIKIEFPKVDNKFLDDIPFVDFAYLYDYWFKKNISASVSDDKIVYTIDGDTSVKIVFDKNNQSVYFSNYDKALQKNDSILSPVYIYNQDKYLQRESKIITRYGSPITVDLNSYGINMYMKAGKVYIPLQTFNDLFNTYFIYNGINIYYGSTADDFWAPGPKERSTYLTDFNYKEFCLRMDLQYGLKDIHNIQSFDKFFTDTGLKEGFYGTAKDSEFAIYKLTNSYIADFHSAINFNSVYAGKSFRPGDYNSSYEFPDYYSRMYDTFDSLVDERKAYFKNKVDSTEPDYKLYEAYDNKVYDFRIIKQTDPSKKTAYVTFDEFSINNVDYYNLTNNGKNALELNNVSDLMGLVIYAQQEIYKNKDIDKVVIDLSANGGGALIALAYIASWLQGNVEITIKNTITNAIESNYFLCDTNLDGEFDSFDSIPGLNYLQNRNIKVYIITSPFSFSCGNLLPTLLKSSGKATIIGKTSGGGACVVGPGCTADSVGYQISSNWQMGYIKNGAFYNTDTGVLPDLYIDDFANIFDREKLNDILCSIK